MLKEMGFSEAQARQALAECVWDVNRALDLLFSRGAPMGGHEETAGSGDVEGEGHEGAPPEDAISPPRPVKAVKGSMGAPSQAADSPSALVCVDSAEHSTTASTASSPRSSGPTGIDGKGEKLGSSAQTSPGDKKAEAQIPGVELGTSTGPVDVGCEPEAEPAAVRLLEAESSEAAGNAADSAAERMPLKQIQRVVRAWMTEATGSSSQMSVRKGDFVRLWPNTGTDNGWVYAEDLHDASKAGWLPQVLFEQLNSEEQRWMPVVQNMEAQHDGQLAVTEGSLLKVSVTTRTTEGWAYAATTGTSDDEGGDSQAGWVPVCCLEWADA